MMKILYLHIGLHKTGTTAIQHFLYDNREVLFQQEGILYPEVPEGVLVHYQHRYVTTLIRENKESEFIEFFRNSMKKSPTVVVSSECILRSFSFINWFERLKKLFDEIKIILYVRRQDHWLESAYSYCIKYQGIRQVWTSVKIEDWIDSFLNNNPPWWYNLDWNSVIDQWADAFGKDNIIVKVFDHNYYFRNSLVDDFMKELGVVDLKDYKIRMNKEINKRISNRNEIEFYRITSKFYSHNKKQKLFSILKDHFDSDNNPLLSPGDKIRILEFVKNRNIILAQKYTGGINILSDYSPVELTDWKQYEGLSPKFIEKALNLLGDESFPEFKKYLKTYHY